MSGNRDHSRSRIAAWAELTGDAVPESVREGRYGRTDAPEGPDGDRGREE